MTRAVDVQPSLATLVAGQESLDWTEAVALVSELCRSVLARDPAALRYPEAASVSVDASVTMLITGDPKARDVTYATQLLQELLGTSPTPPPLREAQDMTRAAGAIIELAEHDVMVYRAAVGAAASQLGLRIPKAGSLSGLCVETGAVLRCDDADVDPRVNREACRKVGLRSMVVVPLVHDAASVGVLKVVSPAPGHFTDGDGYALQLMSAVMAASMYHATANGADELFRRATTDAMTGLANRALFFDRLRQTLSQSRRMQRSFGVLLADMDHLKPMNDEFGHRIGDAAITEMGRRLLQGARESDLVARLGGDEFGVLLATIELSGGAERVIERIRERVAEPFSVEAHVMPLEMSVGLSTFPADGDTPETLIAVADARMYSDKRARRAHRD